MLFLGRVPETHIKNLQSFPYIYFNDVKEAKLDYSVSTTDKTELTEFKYDLTLDLSTNDQLDKRYKALVAAVRALFWKEASIQISINGKGAYKSE